MARETEAEPVGSFGQEIAEQPEVAGRMLEGAQAEAKAAAAAIRACAPAGLVIAARGSSDHAAIYGKYLFETRNRLPVLLAAPSVFGLYRRPPRIQGYAVLAISQSGASPDVVGVIEEANRQGAATVGVTGVGRSRLSRAARQLVRLRTGREVSVPASKTYTASLLALAMISQALDPDPAFARALARVPSALATALDAEEQVQALVPGLGSRMAVVGRGYNLATALELGLKLTETCYVLAGAASVADFLHGPIAAVERGFPVLMIEAAGPTLPQMRRLGRRVEALGGEVATFSDRPRGAVGRVVPVRTGLPEELTPLPFAVAGQLLALRLAAARGLDTTRPRGLEKVTETR